MLNSNGRRGFYISHKLKLNSVDNCQRFSSKIVIFVESGICNISVTPKYYACSVFNVRNITFVCEMLKMLKYI